MIAMDDFIKIEVNKIFPGPVPDQEGVQIELWHDKLTVLIQMPELDRNQLRAFSKGFEQYSCLLIWITAGSISTGILPDCIITIREIFFVWVRFLTRRCVLTHQQAAFCCSCAGGFKTRCISLCTSANSLIISVYFRTNLGDTFI